MSGAELLKNIIYIENFISFQDELFETLSNSINWDNTLAARKTASFGVPYNYSNMIYLYREIPENILSVKYKIDKLLGYESNNCLINYYFDRLSSMGFHSDNVKNLVQNTGIGIVSLGSERTFRFKNKEEIVDFVLKPGSFFYMNQIVQEDWNHAILKSKLNEFQRISLTFRKIK